MRAAAVVELPNGQSSSAWRGRRPDRRGRPTMTAASRSGSAEKAAAAVQLCVAVAVRLAAAAAAAAPWAEVGT